jgi:chromosome partitioning protein
MAKAAGTEARVLLNRVPPRGGQLDETVAELKKSGAALLKSRLGNRVAFSNTLLTGGSAMGRKSVARDEAIAFQKEVMRLLKKLS